MRRMRLHVRNIEELLMTCEKLTPAWLQNGLQAFHGALRLRCHAAGHNRAVGLTPGHAGSEQDRQG